MKKLIFSLICFFACAGLQARITLHQSDFDEKVPLEAFSENPSESHQLQKLYLIETASGQYLFLAEKRTSGQYRARYFSTDMGRFISRDPLGYVDGMGLYNGYFAEWLGLRWTPKWEQIGTPIGRRLAGIRRANNIRKLKEEYGAKSVCPQNHKILVLFWTKHTDPGPLPLHKLKVCEQEVNPRT